MLSEYTTYEKEFTPFSVSAKHNLVKDRDCENAIHFEMELNNGTIIPFTCLKTASMQDMYRVAQMAMMPSQYELRLFLRSDTNEICDFIPPNNNSPYLHKTHIHELFISPVKTQEIIRFPRTSGTTIEQFVQENKTAFDTDQSAHRIYVIDQEYYEAYQQRRANTKKKSVWSCTSWIL